MGTLLLWRHHLQCYRWHGYYLLVIRRTPLKRSQKPIRKRRSKPRRGRVLDKLYLEFVATLPCLVCGRRPVEVAHLGERGLSQKCDDRKTGPLCHLHHQDSKVGHHGQLGRNWWSFHGLRDRSEIFAVLGEMYKSGILTSGEPYLSLFREPGFKS